MRDEQWDWLVQSILTVSRQVQHCQHLLNHLIDDIDIQLPSELVEAGKSLADKTKTLQAALDAQASPNQQQKVL